MNVLALLSHNAPGPEEVIGSLGLAALVCFGIGTLILWFRQGTPSPDPWDDQIAGELVQDEATPLCHHCLSPHDSVVDFCPNCGTPVGQYTNWLPFPYLFSVGHALRTGTAGDFRRSPVTLFGFILFGLTEYGFFAPVYWLMFAWGLTHRHPPLRSVEPQAPGSASG
jgi:hypothetical protein